MAACSTTAPTSAATRASPAASSSHARSRRRSTRTSRDLAELERILAGQAERLGEELASRELAGRTIAIKVRLDDWTTYTRAKTLPEHTADAATIRAVATALLRANAPERPVRLLGVRVGGVRGRRAGSGRGGAGRDAQPAAGRLSRRQLSAKAAP